MADLPFDPDVVRARMKELGITQTKLGAMVGLRQRAISELLSGSRKVSVGEAVAIYQALMIERAAGVQWVRMIGIGSAGTWREAIELPGRSVPIRPGLAGKQAFCVEVIGDSMDKLLPEGGWAVVDPEQNRLYAGRVYLIENDEHETTIKRYRGEPARFEPVSTNPEHQPFDLAAKKYRVIGRIVTYGNDDQL